MNLHPSEAAFLGYLAQARATWTRAAFEGIQNPSATWIDNSHAWSTLSKSLQTDASKAAFAAVVSELLSGVIHTSLVALDNGSSLADATLLTLQDQNGHEFKSFIHEFWPAFTGDAA